MTPQTPSVAPPSDAATPVAVESPETPKRRRFPTLTSKPLLWTVAILAPPLAFVSPIGFFLGEFLARGSLPTVKWELPFNLAVEASRETHNAMIAVVMRLAFVVFFLGPPLGTAASLGAFFRSRRAWPKTLAALLIVANGGLLLFYPGRVWLAEFPSSSVGVFLRAFFDGVFGAF